MFRRMASHGGFPLTGHPPPPTPRLSAAAADAVGLRARRADRRHAGPARGPDAAAAGPDGFRRRGHAGRVLRDPGGHAQRPARPAGIAARPEGEPARGDDDRDGRDAVRLHLRDARPARRHQGAARAAADPGAEGRDARRRVLREEDASVAAARQRARRTPASAGRRRWARTIRSTATIERIVHRILDGFGDNLAIFDELRAELEAFLPAEEQAAEANIATTAEEINEDDRKDLRRRRREVGDRAARRKLSDPALPRGIPAPEMARHARGHLPARGRGQRRVELERRDARGSRLERAAEEDARGSQAPRRAAAVAAEAPRRRRARARNGRRASARAFMANLVEAHAAAVKPALATVASPTAAVAEAARAEAEVAKAAGDDRNGRARRSARRGDGAGRARRARAGPAVLDDEYLEIARSIERGMWVEFEDDDGQLVVREARVDQPAARHLPVHQSPGPEARCR